MKAKNLRNETIKTLKKKLINLLHEQFNINIKLNKNNKKTHILKYIKKDIARIKTIIHEKIGK